MIFLVYKEIPRLRKYIPTNGRGWICTGVPTGAECVVFLGAAPGLARQDSHRNWNGGDQHGPAVTMTHKFMERSTFFTEC